MLQPRIPLRRICSSCQSSLGLVARRNYAQVIDPVKPSQGIEAVSNTTAQVSNERPAPAKEDAALKRYTPRTPGIRHLIRPMNEHLWKGRPLQELTTPKKGHSLGGRNRTGRITVRHRGGGHKRRLRLVDFTREEPGEQFVERIEHDPNRTAHIALVRNVKTRIRSYILAAEGMRAGDVVQSYRSGLPDELIQSMGGSVDQGIVASKTAWRGNCLKLGMIPVGTPIFNISPDRNSPGQIARSAGTHGIIIGKGEDTVQKEMLKAMGDKGEFDPQALTEEQLRKFEKAANYVTVRLSSGEIRLIDKEAVATIGVASNVNYKYTSLGKAGRKRWLGIRPTVRGVAMNTVDHPHGGGRGKSKGNRIPVSPWGTPVRQLIIFQRPPTNCDRLNQVTKLVASRSQSWSFKSDHGTKAREGEAMHRLDCMFEYVYIHHITRVFAILYNNLTASTSADLKGLYLSIYISKPRNQCRCFMNIHESVDLPSISSSLTPRNGMRKIRSAPLGRYLHSIGYSNLSIRSAKQGRRTLASGGISRLVPYTCRPDSTILSDQRKWSKRFLDLHTV